MDQNQQVAFTSAASGFVDQVRLINSALHDWSVPEQLRGESAKGLTVACWDDQQVKEGQ